METSIFTIIDDFRGSELRERTFNDSAPKDNDHVLRANRYEKMIYRELREKFPVGLDEIEADGAAKLDTFPALMRDTFTSLYSLNPRRNDVDTLTTNARHFNVEIMDCVMNCKQYHELKSLCEGH